MATSELCTRPASAGERLQHLLGTGAARVAGMWTAVRNRRAVAKLLSWDDHALHDIGLTRGDVYAAMSGSLREDPSSRLSEFCDERRSAIRALAEETLVRADCGSGHLPVRSVPFPDL